MRELTDHVVSGDAAVQLNIRVLDEPGAGGANHVYEITGFDAAKHPGLQPLDHVDRLGILFQNGPIKEAGVNGITQEALLTVVIDRLRSFQSGPFACDANQTALEHCSDALYALQSRTRERIKRGVEGTNKK